MTYVYNRKRKLKAEREAKKKEAVPQRTTSKIFAHNRVTKDVMPYEIVRGSG